MHNPLFRGRRGRVIVRKSTPARTSSNSSTFTSHLKCQDKDMTFQFISLVTFGVTPATRHPGSPISPSPISILAPPGAIVSLLPRTRAELWALIRAHGDRFWL